MKDIQINAGITADPNNPEWTKKDFARTKPAKEFSDPDTYAGLIALKRKLIASFCTGCCHTHS
jgi:hypothetical protein